MNRVLRRPAANQDLIGIFRYFARSVSITVADRFFAEAEATLFRLSAMPSMGTSYEPEEPLFADVRYFPIIGFKKYLVFYRPIAHGIEFFRVLHGSPDIHTIVSGEFGLDEADDA